MSGKVSENELDLISVMLLDSVLRKVSEKVLNPVSKKVLDNALDLVSVLMLDSVPAIVLDLL